MALSFFKNQSSSLDTPEICYGKRRAAQWLLALSEDGLNLNAELFSCVQWILGDLRSLLKNIKLQTAKFKSASGMAAHHAVQSVLDGETHHYVSACRVLVEEHPCVCSYMGEQIIRHCRSVAEDVNVALPKAYLSAGDHLKQVFGLDDDDIAICEFLFIVQSFSELKNYFDSHLDIFNVSNLWMMAQALSISQNVISSHIRMLLSFGIIEYLNSHSFGLTKVIELFWSSESSIGEGFFCGKLEAEVLPLKSFRRTDKELRHVRRLLKAQVDFPVNLLIYGPSGSGKKTFVHSLVSILNMHVWLVSSRGKRESECRASFLACLHRSSSQKGSILIVDGADQLLNSVFTGDTASDCKSSNITDISLFLGRSGQKIVWITDNVEKMDSAIRRYFTYSMYFEGLGLHERVEMWRHIMKSQGLSRRFNKDSITTISLKYPVNANLAQRAVVQASKLYPVGCNFYNAIESILYSYFSLQNGGHFQSKKIYNSVKNFTLNGVCINEDIFLFMDFCHNMDMAMRSDSTLPLGCGNILFYGPPGTGKTALARFIAESLHRECLVKRASDLLGPFVGMSEQRVAEAFHEMERSGAVLVIDEADSFLYSRDVAHQSWEVTLVNEFLTSLEESRGFCICTTNRMEHIDKAALRRFSYRLQFRYADKAQVKALYNTILAPLCKDIISYKCWKQLTNMQYLTPGDFHVVRERYNPLFTKSENVTHDLLVQELWQEMQLKIDSKNQY